MSLNDRAFRLILAAGDAGVATGSGAGRSPLPSITDTSPVLSAGGDAGVITESGARRSPLPSTADVSTVLAAADNWLNFSRNDNKNPGGPLLTRTTRSYS